MKQRNFEKTIIIEEFEEEKKKQTSFLGNYVQLEVKRITDLISKSDEVIVKEYIDNLQKKYNNLKKYYQILTEKEKKIEDTIYHDNLKTLDNELDACIKWQNGDKDIDISFIPAIEHKKMFLGKNKDEIALELEKIREARDPSYDHEQSPVDEAFDTAVRRYEPVRERVDAIRKMTNLEKLQKASIKVKLNRYLLNLRIVATFSIIPTVFIGPILRVYNILGINSTIAVLGLVEAVLVALGAVGIPIYNKVKYQKAKQDYEIAKKDLEEAGLYEDIKKSLVRSKKSI